MKKFTLLILLLFIVAFYSCDESGTIYEIEAVQADSDAFKGGPNQKDPVYNFIGVLQGENVQDDGCYTETKELYGGQSIDVGGLTYSSDNENIYITYTTEGDWYLEETHLFVGCPEDVPFNNGGNPVIGAFPLKAEHDPMVQSYTYMIPRSNFQSLTCSSAPCEGGLAVITHASVNKLNSSNEVIQQETAFQECTEDTMDFPGNRWGCWDWFCPQDCEEKAVGYMVKFLVPSDRVTCFEDELQGETVYGFSNRFPYHDYYSTPPGVSYPVVTNIGEDCDLSEAQQIGTLTILLGDFQVDAGIKLKFKGSNGYENANGVWSGLVSWTAPVSYLDGKLIPGLESGSFVLNVVNGEAEIEIDEADWPGVPRSNGTNYNYYLISGFVLDK